MRLSVDPADPGHALFRQLRKRRLIPKVSIDGRLVKGCITADTKRGIALVWQEDERGRLRINARRDALLLKQVTGRVEIQIVRTAR